MNFNSARLNFNFGRGIFNRAGGDGPRVYTNSSKLCQESIKYIQIIAKTATSESPR
jgi:hypothetical protein